MLAPRRRYMVICGLSLLLASLAVQWDYLSREPTAEEVREGDVRKLHVSRKSTSRQSSDHRRPMSDDQRLVWWLMAKGDHHGSDVRLTTSELTSPSRIKRIGIEHRWWR